LRGLVGIDRVGRVAAAQFDYKEPLPRRAGGFVDRGGFEERFAVFHRRQTYWHGAAVVFLLRVGRMMAFDEFQIRHDSQEIGAAVTRAGTTLGFESGEGLDEGVEFVHGCLRADADDGTRRESTVITILVNGTLSTS
jgi:hypothetical protein